VEKRENDEMPLGALPYKAKISQAKPDIDQGRSLQIQVFDASSNLLNTFYVDVQDPQLTQWADVQALMLQMHAAIVSQMVSDAGDVGIGLQAVSLTLGG
jgi:hypothetical protein